MVAYQSTPLQMKAFGSVLIPFKYTLLSMPGKVRFAATDVPSCYTYPVPHYV